MPFSPEVQTAIENLKTLYNGDAYDAGSNPGGMGEGGHRQNFEPALSDVGLAGEAVGIAADAVQTQSDDVAVRSTEFRSRFLGTAATPPMQDGNGDPVADGALYWDSNTDTLRVYHNGQWEAPAAAATDYVPASTGGTFTGAVTASAGITGNLTGDVDGDVVGNVTGNLTGNADTATALETVRTITIAGDVDASASFDGTANITLTATVGDDSHTHTFNNLGLGTIASQDAHTIDIDGGNIDNTAIGETTRNFAKVTTLDANDAVTFGTTLGVTGATTLSSTLDVTDATTLEATLDVTGASTFTAATTHNGGVQTNSISGLAGNTVINVPAGQAFELQVDGQKKFDISSTGDVSATGYVASGLSSFWNIFVSANPIGGGAYDGGDLVDSSAGAATGNAYDDATGEIVIPVGGLYFFYSKLERFPSGGNATVKFTQYDSGDDDFTIDLKTVSVPVSDAKVKYFAQFAAGDRLRMELVPTSNTLTTGENASFWYGFRLA